MNIRERRRMVRRRERKLGRSRDLSVGQRFRGRGGEERRGEVRAYCGKG